MAGNRNYALSFKMLAEIRNNATLRLLQARWGFQSQGADLALSSPSIDGLLRPCLAIGLVSGVVVAYFIEESTSILDDAVILHSAMLMQAFEQLRENELRLEQARAKKNGPRVICKHISCCDITIAANPSTGAGGAGGLLSPQSRSLLRSG